MATVQPDQIPAVLLLGLVVGGSFYAALKGLLGWEEDQ